MADADSCAGKASDLVLVHMHRMGEPDVVAEPAELVHIGDRPLAEALQRVALLVDGLGQMGVQAHAMAPGDGRALAHQLGRDREGRARRQRDLQHGAGLGIMIGADHPLAVGEDIVLVLHAIVRRQAAADWPSDIEPRETMKRTPISRAAAIWSSTLQPLRNT